MPPLVKNLTLKKGKREPMALGGRFPDLDMECPSCKMFRGRSTTTFAYRRTVGGKTITLHWCGFEQCYVKSGPTSQ